VHSGICEIGKSLLSRKIELDTSKNQYCSRCGSSLFIKSTLFAHSNCV
ncbi:hypothetical protein AVDCRST_MAG84-4688, partial [uncultured Microcoleus sp.]